MQPPLFPLLRRPRGPFFGLLTPHRFPGLLLLVLLPVTICHGPLHPPKLLAAVLHLTERFLELLAHLFEGTRRAELKVGQGWTWMPARFLLEGAPRAPLPFVYLVRSWRISFLAGSHWPGFNHRRQRGHRQV